MATLPTVRRILAEKFPSLKWMPELLDPLNSFIEQTVQALNRQLTVDQNMAGAFVIAEVDGIYPLKLQWTLKVRPKWVVVGAVARVDGVPCSISEALQVQWSFNQAGNLQIDGVAGDLTVGGISKPPAVTDKYRLTLLCLTG